MSPLRWTQSTGPHCTEIQEYVTSVALICVGGEDGAARKAKISPHIYHSYQNKCPLPASAVIPMTLLLVAIPLVLVVTVSM